MHTPTFGFLKLLLLTAFCFGRVHAQSTTENAPECNQFQEILAEFEKSYQGDDRAGTIQHASQLSQLKENCPSIPETDQFWNVIYKQVTGDTSFISANAKSMDYNIRKGDSLNLMRNLIMEGAYFYSVGRLDEAITNFQTVQDWSKLHKNRFLFEKSTINYTKAFMERTDWPAGLDIIQQAISYAKTTFEPGADQPERVQTMLGNFYLLAGYISTQSSHLEDGKRYLYKAEKIFSDPDNPEKLATTYDQLGSIVFAEGKLDSAAAYYQKGLELTDSTTYLGKLNYSRITFSLANIYHDQKELTKAEDYARISARMDKQLGDQGNYWESQTLLGRIISYSNPVKGEKILLEAHEFLIASERFDRIVTSSTYLGDFYVDQGQAAKAGKYYRMAMQYNDSIYESEMAEAIENARIKYQTAEKEEALRASDELAKARKSLVWTVAIGMVVALLLAILLLVAFIQKKRSNDLLQLKQAQLLKKNEENELLLREIHHRVKNNLQIVSNLLELQARGLDDKTAIEVTKEGQNRVKSMALIHQNLYQNDDLEINFQDYLQKLVSEIEQMYGKARPVEKRITSNGISFDIDTAIPLGLVINELVTNAFKYGFSEKESPVLEIAIEHGEAAGEYVMNFSDNGQGLPEGYDFAKSKSLGLRLVKRLARQLHGAVEQINDAGCKFRVSFKDTAARMEID